MDQLSTHQWIKDPYTLAMTTFWLMHGWLDDGESEYDKQTGNGTAYGILNQNIGPVNAGTDVHLNNNGTTISIQQFDDQTGQLHLLYTFNIIIPEPVIVENKGKI